MVIGITGPVASSVTIGRYGSLNPESCGLNVFTPRMADLCLKWHNDTITGLTDSRPSLQDEANWIAHIHVETRHADPDTYVIKLNWLNFEII